MRSHRRDDCEVRLDSWSSLCFTDAAPECTHEGADVLRFLTEEIRLFGSTLRDGVRVRPGHHLGSTRFHFGSTCLRISASSSRLRYLQFLYLSTPRASWS